MPIAPITYDRFDGGIADAFLNTDKTRYYAAKNLLLDIEGNLYSRDGLSIYSARVPGDTDAHAVTGIYFASAPWERGITVLGRRVYESSSFTEVLGYNSNPALPGKNEGAYEAAVPWQNQWIMCPNGYGYSTTTHTHPQRLYCANFGARTYHAVQLGLPRLALGSMIATPGVGAGTYVYRLVPYYEFTDSDGTVYSEEGPALELVVSSAAAPNVTPVAFTNVPGILAGAGNYDTTNIKIRFFRTVNQGNAFYFVDQVNNGVTVFNDALADTALIDAAPIYTTGDVLENMPPPQDAIYVAEVSGFFWYATKRSVTHSKAGAPGAVPAEYEDFTAEPVKGLTECNGYPILFLEKTVFRLEGNFDDTGGGGFIYRRIHSSAGCVSNRSIVKVDGGVAWAGNGGFYFTDGQQVVKISKEINPRYKIWSNAQMVGAYDSDRNHVYWTVSSSFAPRNVLTTTPLNDAIAVWDVTRGLDPGVFTTIEFDNNIQPSTLFYYDAASTMYMGEARGYALYFSPLRHADPRIDENRQPSAFYDKAIVWNWESAGFNEAPAMRDYATHVTFEAETEGDLAVAIYHRRDETGAWAAGSSSRFDGGCTWNLTDLLWGDEDSEIDVEWFTTKLLDGKHMVHSNARRAQRRQVRLTNAIIPLYNSDDVTTATTAVVTPSPYPTVTLDDVAQRWCDWPEDYEIAFESAPGSGLYTTYYLIRERVSDTVVTVYDPFQTMTAVAGRKWEIRGVRKYERFKLLSISIFSEPESETQTPGRPPTKVNT